MLNPQIGINQSQTLTDSNIAIKLGLSAEEFQRIQIILGRIPNFLELSAYSALWSEHCSYKNSIHWLKKLPREGENVLAAAGEENAGLLAIDEKYAVCFKIESHNHPSAIEPYQGAATGVGGIHRDIFTMGARPIAALNALRFGELSDERTRFLLKGVVRGIGDYGNAFGVATVGGEISFDKSFRANPLVNAMSVGIVERGKTISAIASGVGNPVFIVGSKTGKDGINGAVFASQETHAKSIEQLPAVQVGDPFQEKLLLEATLELIATGAVVGMQDMGAAGIACSTSEMSAKGDVGMDVWLDKTPLRQADMLPFEILLSESQERMLVVAHADKVEQIKAVFEKWDLPCVQIGVVTDTKNLRYYWDDTLVAEIPAKSLVLGGGAPVYVREVKQAQYYQELQNFSQENLPITPNYADTLKKLAQIPTLASKKWVTRQYDGMVGNGSLTAFIPVDAALVAVPKTDTLLALVTDCNSRYVWADPYVGAAFAVAEAARNIACAGGKPIGITNCLNFGNPYNSDVYWQFSQAVEGMRAACLAFGLPVTGGNVSFYNQSAEDGPVKPTPMIGMVGVLHKNNTMSLHFKQAGATIFVIGSPCLNLNSSEYLVKCLSIECSPVPDLDLAFEHRLQKLMVSLIEKQLIESAHDVADGGLLFTVMEAALVNELGCELQSPTLSTRLDAYWFGESGGRVVVSTTQPTSLQNYLIEENIPFQQIGTVQAHQHIHLDTQNLGNILEYKELYNHTLAKNLGV